MSDRYDAQTYYELLEVSPQAGPAEIYSAYQRAKSTYSPSSPAIYSMFSPQEAQELMALIEEAYQTLSHQARRKEYDLKMGLVQPTLAKPVPASMVPPSVTTGSSRKADDQWVGPVKVISRSEEVPAGCGRTKFGVYKKDPEIEKQIEDLDVCDGSFLQKLRTYKGVTLDQVSDEIRVGKATLMALENNDLKLLPVAVFTRGFVLQMARVLNVNERKVVDAYMKFFRSKRS